jgi:tetratricopeptide (TPR) repeat protein
MGRGLAFYQVGQYRNAIDDLNRAIELESDHAFPRKYLGALYHDLGKLELAKQQLDLAIKLDNHDTFARKARGRLLFDQGDYQASLRDFAVAVKIDPSDVEAITGQGVVRHAIGGDLFRAEADFRKAIELAGDSIENAYLWSNLGQTQMELGQTDDALSSLTRAIELDPAFAEARSHRAYLLATTRGSETANLEQAKDDVRAVFASNQTKTYWDYRAVAAINAAEGDYERAVKHQRIAESIVRKTGPRRFIQSAEETRASYEKQSTP